MAVDLTVVAIVFISITAISVLIRVYTRLIILKNLGIDDYFICVGAVFAIASTITPVFAIPLGLGKPTAQQRPEDVAPYQKLMLASSVTYLISATFIKLSLLSFYTRLSRGPGFLILVYVFFFIIIGFGIGSLCTVLLQCIPLAALWDPNVMARAKCIHLIVFYYANAAINIATDIGIFLLPIKTLWGLHMPLRQRISLCALFGLGGLACIASIIRLTSLSSLLVTVDPTIQIVKPVTWSFVELNTSIFIASGPALKAFLRHCMPSLLGSSYDTTSKPNYGSRSKYTQKNSIPLGSMGGNDKSRTIWSNNISAGTGESGRHDEGREGSEAGSQENILMSYHGILQEVTVSVKSERRSISTPETREDDDAKTNYSTPIPYA